MSGVTDNYGFIKPAEGEAYDVDIPNGNMDAVDTQLFDRAKYARGYMPESKTRSSVSTNISALSVVEHIASFNFKADRRYRISWNASYTMTNASDSFTVRIQTCPVADPSTQTTGLTELISRPIFAHSAGAGQPLYIEEIKKYTGDTTLQVKFTCERSLGSGTWQMEASRALFTIEDLGYNG